MTRGYLASLAQARAESEAQAEEDARANAEPCTPEESFLAVQLILDRLHKTGAPLDDLEPAAADHCNTQSRTAYVLCQECERSVTAGWIYGAFRLCRSCVTRRLTLAARLRELALANDPTIERAAA